MVNSRSFTVLQKLEEFVRLLKLTNCEFDWFHMILYHMLDELLPDDAQKSLENQL